MDWVTILLFLGAGFVLLAKGAEWLVGGSTLIARRMGVSALVVGLTVVAWGTSLPEVVVSTMAATQGSAAISIGNVLGSNIANIALVLGACSVVLPAVLEGRLGGREAFWMLASLGLFWLLCRDGVLSRPEGALLLVAFVVHSLDVFLEARRQRRQLDVLQSITGVEAEEPDPLAMAKGAAKWFRHPYFEVLLGMLSIALGAWCVVRGASAGALRLGVDERVVGLTVVALGTSLPELAAGLGGALRGERDISLGNVVGSNVFNVLAVMGITALVHPLDPAIEAPEVADEVRRAFDGALATDFPLTLAMSLFLVALPLLGGPRLGRLKGLVLLTIYVGYSVWLYLR